MKLSFIHIFQYTIGLVIIIPISLISIMVYTLYLIANQSIDTESIAVLKSAWQPWDHFQR